MIWSLRVIQSNSVAQNYDAVRRMLAGCRATVNEEEKSTSPTRQAMNVLRFEVTHQRIAPLPAHRERAIQSLRRLLTLAEPSKRERARVWGLVNYLGRLDTHLEEICRRAIVLWTQIESWDKKVPSSQDEKLLITTALQTMQQPQHEEPLRTIVYTDASQEGLALVFGAHKYLWKSKMVYSSSTATELDAVLQALQRHGKVLPKFVLWRIDNQNAVRLLQGMEFSRFGMKSSRNLRCPCSGSLCQEDTMQQMQVQDLG